MFNYKIILRIIGDLTWLSNCNSANDAVDKINRIDLTLVELKKVTVLRHAEEYATRRIIVDYDFRPRFDRDIELLHILKENKSFLTDKDKQKEIICKWFEHIDWFLKENTVKSYFPNRD